MKKKISLISIIIAVVISAWYLQDYVLTSGYAPTFQFQYFRPATSETQIVLIKNADSSGKALLLNPTDHPQFFRFDPVKEAIEKIDPKEWERSKERELDCWEQSTPDDYSGATYGHYILTAKKSPDDTKIAVLSAYGPKLPGFSIHPGLGGGERIWGTRYLEIRKIPGGESVGRPVRIDISTRIKPSLCWSDGARYVVVYCQDNYCGGPVSVVDVPSD